MPTFQSQRFLSQLLQLDLNKVATILDSLKTRLGDTFVASEEILQDIAVEPKGVELGPVSYVYAISFSDLA